MDQTTALQLALKPALRIKIVGAMNKRAVYSLGTEATNAPGYLLAQQLLEGSYNLDMWATSVVQDAAFLALAYETVGEDGKNAPDTTIYNIVNAKYEDFKL